LLSIVSLGFEAMSPEMNLLHDVNDVVDNGKRKIILGSLERRGILTCGGSISVPGAG
jgi:hypothetical protein